MSKKKTRISLEEENGKLETRLQIQIRNWKNEDCKYKRLKKRLETKNEKNIFKIF